MSLKYYLMFSVFKIGPKACLKAKMPWTQLPTIARFLVKQMGRIKIPNSAVNIPATFKTNNISCHHRFTSMQFSKTLKDPRNE